MNPIGEVKWLFERYDIGVLAEATPQAMADAAAAYLSDPDRAARTVRSPARRHTASSRGTNSS